MSQCTITPQPPQLSFSGLPKEIRDVIWEMHTEPAKIMKIGLKSVLSLEPGWTAFYQLLVLLGVCHKSRQVALKMFSQAYGPQLDGRSIYINFQTDCILLHRGEETHLFFSIRQVGMLRSG